MLLLPVLALGLGAPLTQLFLTTIIFVCSSAHALKGTLNRLDCLIALRQQNNIFLVLFHTCLLPAQSPCSHLDSAVVIWCPARTPLGTLPGMGCSPEGQGRLCPQGCIPTPSCDLISPAVARGGAVMGKKPKALLVPVVLPWAGFMVSFHLAFCSPLALSSVQGKVSQPCLHGHPVKVQSPAISLLLGVWLCRFPSFAPGLYNISAFDPSSPPWPGVWAFPGGLEGWRWL